MPLLFYIRVRSLTNGKLSPFTGGYIRGWLLEVSRKFDPTLATIFHSRFNPKPFCIKPLKPIGKHMKVVNNRLIVTQNDLFSFEIGVIDPKLEDKIYSVIYSTGGKIILGNVLFEIEELKTTRKSYRELYSIYYNDYSKLIITIHFITPTAFSVKDSKFRYLFPAPEKLVYNLACIWNNYAPEKLRIPIQELVEWAKKHIMVKEFDLRTREVSLDYNLVEIGFKGYVHYEVKSKMTPYLNLLLAFAKFSNVGIKRTYGMGVIKANIFQK